MQEKLELTKCYPNCAIIVLANLMDKYGNLNDESRARMDTAVNAFKNEEASYIITTGWAYREDSDIPIAKAMRDYAINKHKIFPESILCDIEARDTVGDAVFLKRNIISPRKWNKLLVITSDYHAARTKTIFEFVYGNKYSISVKSAPSNVGNNLEKEEQKSLQAFHNTFKNVYSDDDDVIFDCLRTKHPFYNGNIYQQIESADK